MLTTATPLDPTVPAKLPTLWLEFNTSAEVTPLTALTTRGLDGSPRVLVSKMPSEIDVPPV